MRRKSGPGTFLVLLNSASYISTAAGAIGQHSSHPPLFFKPAHQGAGGHFQSPEAFLRSYRDQCEPAATAQTGSETLAVDMHLPPRNGPTPSRRVSHGMRNGLGDTLQTVNFIIGVNVSGVRTILLADSNPRAYDLIAPFGL
ncbi:hypothetical protein B0H11DRAFT_2189023 [Mycena galericulata]|nr:hypothetical protein B0H11DRAFT_2189023 [Mycena galericulata]